MHSDRSVAIRTRRLLLRPSLPSDAQRAFEIQSCWKVTRMLALAAWPPSVEDMRLWFDTHSGEWREGQAFRFAVCLGDEMIGLCDLTHLTKNVGELGYWLDEAYWRQGLATEAATAVIGFARTSLRYRTLQAAHAIDNEVSGKLLAKLGFVRVGEKTVYTRPRDKSITQIRWSLSLAGS